MVRIEFGTNYAGVKEYVSRRFNRNGWKGSRKPALRKISYRATLPGREEVTLSSEGG